MPMQPMSKCPGPAVPCWYNRYVTFYRQKSSCSSRRLQYRLWVVTTFQRIKIYGPLMVEQLLASPLPYIQYVNGLKSCNHPKLHFLITKESDSVFFQSDIIDLMASNCQKMHFGLILTACSGTQTFKIAH